MRKNHKYVDTDVATGIYSYRLGAVAVDGFIEWYGPIRVCYNPFVYYYFDILPSLSFSSFNIKYSILHKSMSSLRIYDNTGRLIRALFNGYQDAGIHKVTWDGRNNRGKRVSAGTYFVKFEAGNYKDGKR